MRVAPRYAVIGDPVSQSLSPVLHTGWMSDLGIEATYEAMTVPANVSDPAQMRSHLSEFADTGVVGLNVTAPHKELALKSADLSDDLSREVRAANTLKFTGAGWEASNTDVAGFQRLVRHAGINKVNNVVLLGAGGAARGVALALRTQADRITVLNRTVSRAEDLVNSLLGEKGAAEGLDLGSSAIKSTDLVVNTLSIGHTGRSLDWPDGDGRFLIDISYGQAAERVLDPARKLGWKTYDGLPMLVGQGQESFRTWFGTAPDFDKGLERLRQILEERAQ